MLVHQRVINLKHLNATCHNMAFASASWPWKKSSYGSKTAKAIAAVFVCWGDLSPGESNDRCGGMGVCSGNCWAIFTQIISNVMKWDEMRSTAPRLRSKMIKSNLTGEIWWNMHKYASKNLEFQQGQPDSRALDDQERPGSALHPWGDDTVADWRDTLRYLGHLLLKQDKRASATISSLPTVSRVACLHENSPGLACRFVRFGGIIPPHSSHSFHNMYPQCLSIASLCKLQDPCQGKDRCQHPLAQDSLAGSALVPCYAFLRLKDVFSHVLLPIMMW